MGFFEGFTDSRWQAIDGSANFDLHLIQLAANVLVGFKFLAPLGAHGFHVVFVLGVDLANLSRVEVYQLLGLILREPKFSEQGVADSMAAASRVCPSGTEKSV